MKCSNCQMENVDGARFCQSCGSSLAMVSEPMVESKYRTSTASKIMAAATKKQSDRPLVALILSLLAIANFWLVSKVEFDLVTLVLSLEEYTLKYYLCMGGIVFGALFVSLSLILLISCCVRNIYIHNVACMRIHGYFGDYAFFWIKGLSQYNGCLSTDQGSTGTC